MTFVVHTHVCIILDLRCIAKILFPLLTLFGWIINWLHLCFTFLPPISNCNHVLDLHEKKKNYMQVAEFLIRFSSFTSAPSYSEKKKKALLKQIYNSNICKSRGKKRSQEYKHFGILSLDVSVFLFLIYFCLIQVEPDGFCICQLATVTINSHLILKCWLTHS